MKYKITVGAPCHENWNTMNTTERGRFCKNCNKEVIDFTKLSNIETLHKVLQKPNLCGRFNEKQLNKDIEINPQNSVSAIAASLALISVISYSEPIFSQEQKDSIQETFTKKSKMLKEMDSLKKYSTIKGNVKDISGCLPAVSIHLKDSGIGTQSDFDGNFSIKIPNKKRNSFILVFSYLGYKTQEIDILSIKKPLIVTLQEVESVLGGMSVTVGMVAVEKRPSIFKRIGNLFRKKEN